MAGWRPSAIFQPKVLVFDILEMSHINQNKFEKM